MPWPLCLWQCIKTNHETKTFETGIETPYETKSFKSKTCISLENNISIARTLRVIDFTLTFYLEICEIPRLFFESITETFFETKSLGTNSETF